jgi:hypothetical protein
MRWVSPIIAQTGGVCKERKRDFPRFTLRLKDFLPKSFGYAQKQLSNVHFEFFVENDEGYRGEYCKMQEQRRTVAIATEKGGEWKRVYRGELESAVRLSVVDGRRSFMEKGRKMRFSVVKSVRKYQIVGNNQKPLSGMRGLRAFKRLRNSRHKSCKKELIPGIDYVIVSINLEKEVPLRPSGYTERPVLWTGKTVGFVECGENKGMS